MSIAQVKPLSRRSDLSPQYAVMGFLNLQPMHGYDLHRQLQGNLHEVWRISLSQVYNILKRLEKRGWVTGTRLPQEKLPDRALFSLTETGKHYFQDWLLEPTRGSGHALRVEFITRLFFASRAGEDLYSQLIQEQIARTQADLDTLREHYTEIPVEQSYNRLGVDLRIRQIDAILDWLQSEPAAVIAGES